MDMRFGTWNVSSFCRSGSLKTVSGELAKYKLDLVRVQEVRWDKGGTEENCIMRSCMVCTSRPVLLG
jgi:exonuclease III